MTQEDKELLLKDLCARLPYGVKINEDIQGNATLIGLTKERALTTCEVEGKFNDFPIELVKPYLFPLSSMTEEHSIYMEKNKLIIAKSETETIMNPDRYDFLNKNHFDYRGLIEKCLAIDATGKNIY